MRLKKLRNDEYAKYFTDINSRAFSNITRQLKFLAKNNRLPLAIFMRGDIIVQMLQYVYSHSIEKQQRLLSIYANEQNCICHVLGLPVYLNIKLTKSQIIVVGEIEWI